MNRTDKKTGFVFKCRNTSGRKGVAAVEFALSLSLWMILLLGIFDGSYYLLVNEKVDRIAYTVSDIVTQYDATPSHEKLSDIMMAAGQLMQPMSFNPSTLGTPDGEGDYPEATGYIIVTSVYQDPTQGPIVKWQYTYPPAGNGVSTPTSSVGNSAEGSLATLPNGLTLNSKDNVIVTEVFYTFSPLFLDQFVSKVIRRETVFKPRLGGLIVPPA
ncbi:MAG: TadE/TadG family type IV pilus assembly protein [Bdellovibrionales bacterium]